MRIACSPELQKRLMVMAGVVTGWPDRSVIFSPASPSGIAQPMMTSSTYRFLANSNKFVQGALGGWSVSSLVQITSGLPRSVLQNGSWPTNWNYSGSATQTGASPVVTTTKNAPGINKTGGPNFFPDPVSALAAYDFTYGGQVGPRHEPGQAFRDALQ